MRNNPKVHTEATCLICSELFTSQSLLLFQLTVIEVEPLHLQSIRAVFLCTWVGFGTSVHAGGSLGAP